MQVYVPKVQYQAERARVLYEKRRATLIEEGDGETPIPVPWEETTDIERTAWIVVAVEPMPVDLAQYVDDGTLGTVL